MLELDLTAAERDAYMRTLRSSRRIRIGVDVLDRDEKVIRSLSSPASSIIGGSVDVDARADITRSLRLELLDPNHALGFDADSPARTGLFADNFIAVRYGVLVDELASPTFDGWIDCPVFWGPLTDYERNGDVLRLEGLGKDALGLDPHFATQGYTIRKGRRVDDAIRDVMGRLGEARYNMPDLPQRLPRARAVQPEDEPWNVVKFGWDSVEKRRRGRAQGEKRRKVKRVEVEYNGLVALAGHFTAYYNGRGQLTVRRRSTNPVVTLAEGRDLEDRPTPTYDVLEAVNHVVVTGAKVTVGKKPNRRQIQRRASATLPSEHPLSPSSLARNGKPRRMVEFLAVDNLKTEAACRDRAKRVLDERSRDGLSISLSCLPFPFLEELDFVRVETDTYSLDLPLQRYTIPLDEGLMTIGYER